MTLSSVGSNPSPFTKPGAAPPPVHVATAPGLSLKRLTMLHWAAWGTENQAHFVYTETAERSQMFNLKPGEIPPGGIHADCSQFYSSVERWAGGTICNDTDYTGTLLEKGTLVDQANAKPADCVIWGPGTGEHAAMLTENDEGGWWTVGFGHSPGAPDRVLLSDMTAWMVANGHPDVRFLSFAP
jgi:hypothetical protein